MEKIKYARIWKNGLSLVTTIPQKTAKKLGVKEGDRVHVTLEVV